jgi:hypothetical protein
MPRVVLQRHRRRSQTSTAARSWPRLVRVGKKSPGATVVVGWAPTPPPARRHGKRRGSDKEASMVVSWTVVSWVRHVAAGLALVVLALLGIEVALFLLAAAFM